MKNFLSRHELSSASKSTETGNSQLEKSCREASGYTNLLVTEACQCPHLKRWLPHILDLRLARLSSSAGKQTYIIQDPIHALHMSSQLDNGTTVCITTPPPSSGQHSASMDSHGNVFPWLYGEEHQRTAAQAEDGIRESFFPSTERHLDHDFSKKTVRKKVLPVRVQPSTDPLKLTQRDKQQLPDRKKLLARPLPPPTSNPSFSTAKTKAMSTKYPPPVPSMESPPTPSLSKDPKAATAYLLPDARFQELSHKEDQIRAIRAWLSKRIKKKNKKRKADSLTSNGGTAMLHNSLSSNNSNSNTSHNNNNSPYANNSALSINGGALYNSFHHPSSIQDMTREEKEDWDHRRVTAGFVVDTWMENFRASRRSYWEEQSTQHEGFSSSFWGGAGGSQKLLLQPYSCRPCTAKVVLHGDELMQCLECAFVGSSPSSIVSDSEHQPMLQHLFVTGHKFAVTCGPKAEIFCFKCGDFVYHKVFDQEKERVDLEKEMPNLAWKDHPVKRSFDPLHFMRMAEGEIVWRGLVASYPTLVSPEHAKAADLILKRQVIFEGRLGQSWPVQGRNALNFAYRQHVQSPVERWRVGAPVGMYNLGNTCFHSSILQCLINCLPLQKFFLKDIGHHHKACKLYRDAAIRRAALRAKETKVPATGNIKPYEVCLACELDVLFLKYFGSTTGIDVLSVVNDLSRPRLSMAHFLEDTANNRQRDTTNRGEPLITSDMLTVAWQSGGMDHLAGYEQRDAHEYLQAFLDILGKHIRQHHELIDSAINMARPGHGLAGKDQQKAGEKVDVVKQIFEGSLRSVLICQECGSKRTLSEPFLNISLPLTLGTQPVASPPGQDQQSSNLTLSSCLQHFTSPENLSDPLECPTCKKKTQTKKQHTFAKLPRVLCVHLKRFDAAQNKKLENFVSYPAWGLNMGPHLPHWREISTLPNTPTTEDEGFTPEILYDLFGTVNHTGTLQSGHYSTHVKVKGSWFRCNDAHVSATRETDVVNADGTYILFYMRREPTGLGIISDH